MVNVATNNPSIEVISQHEFAEIILNHESGQNSLHALKTFDSEAVICEFGAADVFLQPNYLTVQRGIDEHITLQPQFLQYINHSCDPNVFFDTDNMQLIALKKIGVNEEFTFFYPSTELDMAQPFICYCGSKKCFRNIKGAKYIPANVLHTYRLTQFIQYQLLHKL